MVDVPTDRFPKLRISSTLFFSLQHLDRCFLLCRNHTCSQQSCQTSLKHKKASRVFNQKLSRNQPKNHPKTTQFNKHFWKSDLKTHSALTLNSMIVQPPQRTPLRNKGFIAGLLKGNSWFYKPWSQGRLFLMGYIRGREVDQPFLILYYTTKT